MNLIFYGIVLVAVVFAAITGTPAEVGKAALDAAKSGVDLAIGLAGAITLFLGLMAVVEAAGGLDFMARLIRPLLVRLFPDVPADHPAMGAIIMNLSANVLGLGNAATPFGLKAMKELDSLNDEKGTATDAMVLFLAINTSGVAVLPTGVIALRNKLGSVDPAAIFPTTLLATSINTLIAAAVAILLAGLPIYARKNSPGFAAALARAGRTIGFLVLIIAAALTLAAVGGVAAWQLQGALGGWSVLVGLGVILGLYALSRPMLPQVAAELSGMVTAGALLAGLVAVTFVYQERASSWILPGLIFSMLTIGVVRKVKVYETFIKGAKEGFQMSLTIIPYLVAILAAVGMLRASGGLDRIVGVLSPFTSPLGLPGEVLPLALLRPLSGSGAFALMSDLTQTHGPDSYIGQLAGTMNGSSETTFYVLAVYFGSVGVLRSRHAVATGLISDLFGVIGSIIAVKLLL